ncbi:polyphosphoinositide phosphatase-like protein Fig4 [Phyllosticta citricarpa]|uniref:Polyphosphoinositide phosphatase-like protein Fig4 n=1 Tax=Phyllosticta citricarpa TaxID=55181 RepID=A0ABR1LUR5_9PEZI
MDQPETEIAIGPSVLDDSHNRLAQTDGLHDASQPAADPPGYAAAHAPPTATPPINDFLAPDDKPDQPNDRWSQAASPVPLDDEYEEPAEPKSFERYNSPAAMHRNRITAYEKVDEDGIHKMHKFTLYETSHRFYLVGADVTDMHFRVLKIDRTAPPGHLNIFEDDIVYDRKDMNQLLNTIDDGNKGSGGLKLKCVSWGLLGFIRFTDAYYMLVITKRIAVAMLGGHYIYQVDGTDMIPLTTGSGSRFAKDRNPEESRFLGILNNLDLTRSFYFSYAYNITRSLQQNMIREREAIRGGHKFPKHDFQDMFVWNHYLLDPARAALKNTYDWCTPIIHGFIDQSSLDVFGRRVYITIIARRSRFFAGARFLKRGTNDLGYVANDVETEQIVSDLLTTSFHAPGPRPYANPTYTSYVQHRGSIPLYWTQDNSGVTPKPDIILNLVDPFYSAAALHFNDLFERYGAPIYVLNLIKARERTPRESKLLHEYKKALDYLNQSLPEDKQILYKAFDMSRASKTRGMDVIGSLELIAEDVLEKTGFFHNGDTEFDMPQVQNGVARTNCIDCLDRTNAAQFVIGKRALGRQLQALGVIAGNIVEYDSDAVNIFTYMFHDHGDTIAIQYGGSHLVNTMATYRKINHWQSHSRDMVESFKRYYHNSFLDSQRQEAYNLFLGNYVFSQGQPMLWDLSTDYYLHHTDPKHWPMKPRNHYITWFTPTFLEPRMLPPSKHVPSQTGATEQYDDYWLEYYRPLALSSLGKVFTFKLNSTPRYVPDKTGSSRDFDLSPFRPRKHPHEIEQAEKKVSRKGVTILEPHSEEDSQSGRSGRDPPSSVPDHHPHHAKHHSILRDPYFEINSQCNGAISHTSSNLATSGTSTTFKSGTSDEAVDKSSMTQWTLNQFVHNSLNPSVTTAEASEYERYISHPLNLPLVVSTELPDDFANMDFVEYVNSVNGIVGGGSVAPLHNHQHQQFHRDTASAHTHASLTSGGFGIGFGGGGAGGGDGYKTWEVAEEELSEYRDFLNVPENPLTVREEDGEKKRYKRYRQWLRGKSLFKQSKVDPEYTEQRVGIVR